MAVGAARAFCTDADLDWLRRFSRIVAKAVGATGTLSQAPTAAVTAVDAGVAAPATGSREELLLQLKQHDWNISRVARTLGVTRRTVYLRLARFKVRREKAKKGRSIAAPGPSPVTA